jgi:glutamine amidotransferase-like uncharacterized protein
VFICSPSVCEAQRVALYDDTALAVGGSWPAGLSALRSLLDAADIPHANVGPNALATGALGEDFDLLLVGGGWAGGYRRYLTAGAYDQIRRFVAEGGVYVGICAGAFLASDVVVWRPDAASPRETYDYPLNLYPGVARGPIVSLKPWTETTGCPRGILEGAEMTRVTTALGDDVPLLYYGGPVFRGADVPGLEVLARYNAPGTSADGEAAIIRFPYGEGWVVLFSPHAEIAFEECRFKLLAAPRDFLTDVLVDTLALAEPAAAEG